MKSPYHWKVFLLLSFLFLFFGASLMAQNQTSTKPSYDQAVFGIEKEDFLQQQEAEQKARMEELHQAQMQELEEQFQLEKQKHPYRGQKASESDSLALVALYNATNGENWINNENWLIGPVGTWFGVTIDGAGHVIQLDLSENNLTGILPLEIENLSYLTILVLEQNVLSGNIPSQIGNMTSLQYLTLRYNQLNGNIPSEIGNLSNLTDIILDVNQLSGQIPIEIGNLSNLIRLNIDQNQISGNIPVELSNLSNLTNLSIAGNQLNGNIPSEIGNLTNLVQLSFTNNQLDGIIPSELGNLTNLYYLSLEQNQLTGNIPPTLGNLSSLVQMKLHVNQLSGEIPLELGNLTNLEILRLDHNQLSGEIPIDIGNLLNLTQLVLWSNQLSGSIPLELGDLSNLTYLDLDVNQLSGTIPDELGNLNNLSSFYLSSNQLTGPLPTDFCNFWPSISILWIHNNLFDYYDCPDITCLKERGLPSFNHSPQSDGFNFHTDCQPELTANVFEINNVGLSWNAHEEGLLGFNVFRDGMQLNSSLITEFTYFDLGLAYNMNPCYEYSVHAHYSDGSITISNAAIACISGVGSVDGTITELLTANPIEGTTLSLYSETGGENYTATTDVNGYYSIDVLEDSYYILAEADGYISQDISNYVVNYNGVYTQDFQLDEFPYAPPVVIAEENNENSVTLYYNPDMMNQWLIYDNDQMTYGGIGAEATDYSLIWASKFPPEDLVDYSNAFVTKVAVYQGNLVGDYLTEVRILSGDGSNILYTQDVTGELLGNSWNTIDLDQAVPFNHEENLWVAMYVERPGGTFCEPTAGALNPELSERYDYFAYNGAEWTTIESQYGDTNAAWMLRCFLTSTNTGKEVALGQGDYKTTDHKDFSKAASIPTGNGMIATSIQNEKFPLKNPSSSKDLNGYNIYRVDIFNNSALEFIGYTPSVIFTDNGWGSLNWGTYKWAVEAVYTNNVSEMTFSNVLEKDMETIVNINVSTNSGDSPEGAYVLFTNKSGPDAGLQYSLSINESGTDIINPFRKGIYDIVVQLSGFATIRLNDVLIEAENNFTWQLEELLAAPSNLNVTPIGMATWNIEPFEPFFENFDTQEQFDSWQVIVGGSNADSWFWTTSDAGNTIDGTPFAFVDSDAAGPGSTMNELLISPVINASNAAELVIEFDQYYNNLSSAESADVDVWDGSTWVNVLHQSSDQGSWASPTHITLDVSEYANADFKLRFHYIAPGWDWYWAIDNVSVHDNSNKQAGKSLQNYQVWLDDSYITDVNSMYYQYGENGETLVSGQTYLAEIAVVYSSGISAKKSFEWTYLGCESFPGVENFTGEFVPGSQSISLNWNQLDPNTTIEGLEFELMGVNIYRDEVLLSFIPLDDGNNFIDSPVPPGEHNYCTEIVYTSDAGMHTWESCSNNCVDGLEVPYPAGNVIATEMDENTVKIIWNQAAEWLYYDDGINIDGIGGPATFSWAVKFDPDQLVDYSGCAVTKIQIFARTAEPIILSILQGEGFNSIYSETLTDLIVGDWNEVNLAAPTIFDHTQSLWISCYTENGANYPAACGTAVGEPNSDLISLDGTTWEHLSDYGLPNSWNLRAFVTNAAGKSSSNNHLVKLEYKADTSKLVAAHMPPSENAHILPSGNKSNKEMLGFNIYRTLCNDHNQMEFLDYTTETEYFDNNWGNLEWGAYSWAVEAVYSGNNSEKTFSNCLDSDMEVVVDVQVTTNSGDSPEGCTVIFTNTSEPYLNLSYEIQLDGTGIAILEPFRKGEYLASISLNGFETIVNNYMIDQNSSFTWELIESLNPPNGLYVTPTGNASWFSGGAQLVHITQDPGDPADAYWQNFNYGYGVVFDLSLYPDAQASSIEFHHASYGLTGIWDYNIHVIDWDTKNVIAVLGPMSTTGDDQWEMDVPLSDISLLGAQNVAFLLEPLGNTVNDAYPDLSSDDLQPKGSVYGDLSNLNGMGSSTIGSFLMNINILTSYGENKKLSSEFDYQPNLACKAKSGNDMGDAYSATFNQSSSLDKKESNKSFQNYKVYHNGSFITDVDDTKYTYGSNGEALISGETYLAEVEAVYTTGVSEKIEFQWTYLPCYSFPGVENLQGISNINSIDLMWDEFSSSTILIDGTDFIVSGINIYRDDELISFINIPSSGYTDAQPPFGEHTYCVEVVYSENGLNTWTSCTNNCVSGLEVPYPVSDLLAIDINNLAVELTWQSPSNNKNLSGYNIYRSNCDDTENLDFIGFVTQEIFTDNSWESTNWGVYHWAVEAVYSDQVSLLVFSNCLDKDMEAVVDVEVTTNSGDAPEGCLVSFTNISEPSLNLSYEIELDGSGISSINPFRKGYYDISLSLNGFEDIEMSNIFIGQDELFSWELIEQILPVSNLYVSPVGLAEYNFFSPFFENFDSQESFNNWEVIHNGSSSETWHWTTSSNNGNSLDGTGFAYVDADAGGPGVSMDEQLISPIINTIGYDELIIEFDIVHQQIGDVLNIDVWDGDAWVNVAVSNSDTGPSPWGPTAHMMINATEYKNAEFRLRFHYLAGWDWFVGIDNVSVHDGNSGGSKSLQSFNLYHDGIFSGSTSEMTYNYDYAHYLVSGQTYLAEVEAVYTTGVSEKIAYEWTWLPCDDFPGLSELSAENVEASKDVLIQWLDPNPEHELGMGARISRDGSVIAYIDAPETSFLDQNLEPGYHDYCVEKVYSEDNGAHSWTSCEGELCVNDIFVPEDCFPPENLTVEDLTGEGILATLNWDAPNSFDPVWLQYGDGVATGQVGGPAEFSAASKFEVDQIADLEGGAITKIKFFYMADANGAVPLFTLKVWTGDNGMNLVYEQALTSAVANAWNEIELDTPVAIDITQPIWIGYYIFTNGAYSAGTGTGYPDINSDWVLLDGGTWEHLTAYLPDVHWSLGAYVESANGKEVSLGSTINDNAIYSGIGSFKAGVQSEVSYPDPTFTTREPKEFISYNVYRDGQQIATDLSETTYEDEISGLGTYCYEVTAVYSICGESDPSNEACLEIPCIVSVNPITQSVHTSQVFSTTIEIADVVNLGGFEMDLNFDPAYLQANSVTLESFLGSTGRQVFPLTNNIDNINGLIEYAVTTLGSEPAGPDGDGILLTIEWSSLISLEEDVITELLVQNLQITEPDGAIIPSATVNGEVEILACYVHDFDCDCDVDVVDVTMVAFAYGTSLGDADFNPMFDLDNDNDVDVVDVTMVAYDYGWNCSNKNQAKLSFENVNNEDVMLSFSDERLISEETPIYEVDLRIENVQQLGGFEITLDYQTDELEILEVFSGDFIQEAGREEFPIVNQIDPVNGRLTYAISSLGHSKSGANGEAALITLRYRPKVDKYELPKIIQAQLVRPDAVIIPFKTAEQTEWTSSQTHIISTYPSPVVDRMWLKYQLGENGSLRFHIHDVFGQLIYSTEKSWVKSGVYQISMEDRNLSPGVYVYSMEYEGQIVDSKRIIVQ